MRFLRRCMWLWLCTQMLFSLLSFCQKAVKLENSKLFEKRYNSSEMLSQDSLTGVLDSTKRRFLSLSYFPFVLKRPVTPIPECVDESKCVSNAHCAAVSGSVKGKCFKGFAVCCAMEAKCGSTVRTNETYLVNNDYPNPATTLGNCQYNIEKEYCCPNGSQIQKRSCTQMHKDICQLRLDMETLVLVGPDSTSQCSQDTFSVSGGTSSSPFVICGINSGQHMYIELAAGSVSARINIATATHGYERTWRVKVSQIACTSRYKAPSNCVQYFTDYFGEMKSFNYQESDGVHQIANQMYTACFEAKPGFCGITFRSYDFSLSNDGSDSNGRALSGDSDCQRDFVSIFTASKERIVTPDRYCGNRFFNVTTFSKPFEVRVVTDDEEENDRSNHGFNLHYVQIPC